MTTLRIYGKDGQMIGLFVQHLDDPTEIAANASEPGAFADWSGEFTPAPGYENADEWYRDFSEYSL